MTTEYAKMFRYKKQIPQPEDASKSGGSVAAAAHSVSGLLNMRNLTITTKRKMLKMYVCKVNWIWLAGWTFLIISAFHISFASFEALQIFIHLQINLRGQEQIIGSA